MVLCGNPTREPKTKNIYSYLRFPLSSFQGNWPYCIQAIEKGQGVRGQNVFTTVGKPKMTQQQYNSPMEMYSKEDLEEIMRDGKS